MFLIFRGLIHKIKSLIVLGSLKNLPSTPKVIYYMLDNNFFYTQLGFAFDLQKDFYVAHFFSSGVKS